MLLYFTLLHFAGAGFPEDSEPISISHGNCKYKRPEVFICLAAIAGLKINSILLFASAINKFVFHDFSKINQFTFSDTKN